MNSNRRSPLALVILGLLTESPMHAYRMQVLIKQRGKDRVVNVRQRASLHQTLSRLERLALVKSKEEASAGPHPDRVLYSLTARGRKCSKDWLREALSTPAEEFPEFPAAISLVTMLAPEDVETQLRARIDHLKKMAKKLASERRECAHIPEIFLLESDFQHAMLKAELRWLEKSADALSNGSITWSREWLKQIAAELSPADLHSP